MSEHVNEKADAKLEMEEEELGKLEQHGASSNIDDESSGSHASNPESDEEGGEVDKICTIITDCKRPSKLSNESCEKRMLTPSPTTDCMRRYPCKSAKVDYDEKTKFGEQSQESSEDRGAHSGPGSSHQRECAVFNQVLQEISSGGVGQHDDEEKFIPISVPHVSQSTSNHSSNQMSLTCSDKCKTSSTGESSAPQMVHPDLSPLANSSTNLHDGVTLSNSEEDSLQVLNNEQNYYPPHINDLPSLLMSQILSYLTMRELLHTASLVCKAWYQAAREPALWKRLTLDKPNIVDEDLCNLVSINPYLCHLRITDCRKITEEGVGKALASCSALKELTIMRCNQLKADAFLDVGEHCPLLTKINFSNSSRVADEALEKIAINCPNLTELRLNRCTLVSDKSIQEIARRCPKLRVLSFQENQRITDESLSVLCTHSHNMEVLSLHKCAITNYGVMDLHKLSRIQNLDLSNLATLRSDGVSAVVRNLPNLHTLNLCLSKNICDGCLHTIATSCKKLKFLFLVSCNITDEGLISIGRHNRSIEHMDIGWCQGVTDRGATALSQTCPQLNYLGLVRCDKITEECMSRLVVEFPHIHYSTFLLDSKRLFEKARQQGYTL